MIASYIASIMKSIVLLLIWCTVMICCNAQGDCSEGALSTALSDLAASSLEGAAMGQATGGVTVVTVIESQVVCLATAATRGQYRFASVVVNYTCTDNNNDMCPSSK